MKLVKRIFTSLSILILFSVLIYVLGPKPDKVDLSPDLIHGSSISAPPIQYVESTIRAEEADLNIKPGNESILYWADSVGRKTEYVLLYLHGFSASPVEGDPVHTDIAKKFGMNLYAPRLADHGLVEEENMLHFTAEKYIISAQRALAVAARLGEKVILMTTSTGSTVGLYLASSAENKIDGLICYSPNIKVFDPKADLLAGPWGLEIARVVKGGNYHSWDAPVGADSFWHTTYRLEALVELQRLIEGTMTDEVFRKVSVPTFVGYYYKDEVDQDSVISIAAIQDMYKELGTQTKAEVVLPKAGKHCMPSRFFGEEIEHLTEKTSSFLIEEIGLVVK